MEGSAIGVYESDAGSGFSSLRGGHSHPSLQGALSGCSSLWPPSLGSNNPSIRACINQEFWL